jgi:hypothetical protein
VSRFESVMLALLYVFAIAGAMWLIVAALRWLGARSPWRRK